MKLGTEGGIRKCNVKLWEIIFCFLYNLDLFVHESLREEFDFYSNSIYRRRNAKVRLRFIVYFVEIALRSTVA